jgi:hypothetical protein
VQWGLYFLVPCDYIVIVRSSGVTRCKFAEQILCNHFFFFNGDSLESVILNPEEVVPLE